MPEHKVYRHENGEFLIRASGTNNFFVHTAESGDGGGGGGGVGVPGLITTFTVSTTSLNTTLCDPYDGNIEITFDWNAPYGNGGSPITGYAIRRYLAQWDPSSNSYVAGQLASNFDLPCSSPEVENNPILLPATPTIYSHTNWLCVHYFFDIAAVNANGIGPYSTAKSSITVGNVGYDLSITNSNLNITYTSTQGWCPFSNYQNTTARLIDKNNNLISTYSGFSPGTATFSRPSVGWYKIEIEETWTDYTNSCSESRNGCLEEYFYVPVKEIIL